jgi:hypothetical protein
MATEHEFRIDCETCGLVTQWAESAPTDCPNDAGHTITADNTTIVDQRNTASFVSSGSMVNSSVSVTEDSTWQKIAEKSTSIQSLLATTGHDTDLSSCYGRLTINAEVAGTGAQLKIAERDESTETETDLMSSPSSVAATSGKHAISKHTTDVTPAAGDRTFILYARLNGATSFDIDNGSLTLIGRK